MTMHNIIKMAALSVSILLTSPAFSQDEVEIKVQKLSETISVLFGQGGNIGVSAGPDGVYLIDDQFAELSEKVKAAIKTISDKPVRYVINTHWHFDHTGGNEHFGQMGADIIAHDNVRKRMVTGGYVKAAGRVIPAAPKDALPVITFNDTLTIHLNGEEAQLLHVKAAHTDGDGIVWFKKSNIVHMGDTFFHGMYPFIDRTSGGSIDGIIAAAEMTLAKVNDETQIIPGHGEVTNKAGLKAYRDMCIAMRGKIAAMKKSGMSIEAVIAANPTADYDETLGAWGEAWNNIFVTALYEDAP